MNDLLEVEEADTPDVSMQVVGDGPWDQQPMAYKQLWEKKMQLTSHTWLR